MPPNANKPRVVLVRPRDLGSVPPGAPVQDPLGVGYLASALRARGYEVYLLDAHALGVDTATLAACALALDPDLVGLSLHSFADYKHCVEFSRILRAGSRAVCVWGGEHATYNARRILEQHPEVDAVVLGEGEATVVEMAESVNGDGFGTRPIAGAFVRLRDGGIADGGHRPSVSDLDAIPRPAKDIVETALLRDEPVSLSLLTGRGCTHSCTFCTAHDFMRLAGGKVWRRQSPRRVVDEIVDLKRRYLGHPRVHPVIQFQDVIFLGTSTAAKHWVEDFIAEMRARSLSVPFYCMVRADAIIANEGVLRDLVDVGLWSVEMGIETGVDRILQLYNKLNAVSDNVLAVELMRKHGVTFDASGYIMFDPRMTLEEVRENARYLEWYGAATWDFFVTRLQLYPGTAVRAELVAQGRFDDEGKIDKTSGYLFEDERVEAVASYAYYYDIRIRKLDLLLRDAKAHAAQSVRAGDAPRELVTSAIRLVHRTYCDHLLHLCDLAERGALADEAGPSIAKFMARVDTLTELLAGVLHAVSGPITALHEPEPSYAFAAAAPV